MMELPFGQMKKKYFEHVAVMFQPNELYFVQASLLFWPNDSSIWQSDIFAINNYPFAIFDGQLSHE